jgi:hypothetical protein
MKTILDEKNAGLSKHEKVLNRAHERFRILYDAEQENKQNWENDIRFAYNIDNGQWEETDIQARTSQRPQRPYLTMNKIFKFLSQVVNAEKGVPNTDDVIPVDSMGDQQIANIFNELITHIEYHSNAADAYHLAGEHAVGGGFGYWRIITEWENDGFNQIIKILPIENPLMVSLDPKKKYAFIREALSKDDFINQYPNVKDVTDFEDYSGWDDYELWYENEIVWIAEYFEKVKTKKILIQYRDGNGEIAEAKVDKVPKGYDIIKQREIDDYKLMWYKISGTEVLEEKEWAGSEIPIVEVVGHEIHLLGKSYKRSLHRDAKDAQKMYNYWLTAMTEKVALSPKAPYLVTKQQINGHEKQWDNANWKNYTYMYYNNVGGTPPARQAPTPIDPGSLTLMNIADQNIKDILGMYESSAGAPSNERSGKAIDARNARSDQGVLTFQDNLRKAKYQTKKILIELIPKIYDNERIVRLRHKDSAVSINQPMMVDGEVVLMNNVNQGKYDIRSKDTISPSQRQQAVNNISAVMQYAPDYAGVLLPLALNNMDAPGSEEMMVAIQQDVKQKQLQLQQEKASP